MYSYRPASGGKQAADFSVCLRAVAETRDKEAFRNLFCFFAPRLKRYFIQIGTIPASAEDIAQDALLAVWCKADRFDPAKASAAAWIFAIARNLYIDRKRRERNLDLAKIPDAAPEPTAVELLLAEERDRRMQAALDTIPSDQLRVIRLAFFEEQTHTEIAIALEVPLGTVKSRSRLAMNRLREAVHLTE